MNTSDRPVTVGATHRHLRRLRKHGGFLLLSVAGQLACRATLPTAALREANDVVGNFLQTFGGMYGIIVAFVMFMVWQQHNETQVSIEREATTLGELFRVVSWLSHWPARDEVRTHLLSYAHDVPIANGEKPAAILADERSMLEQSFAAFLAYRPSSPADERLCDSALGLFQELSQTRAHRLAVAALRLPDALRWFVYIGGALTATTLWVVRVDALLLHVVLTCAMTWVVVGAASIINDLDDPYTGDFVVAWDRFSVVATRMEALICPAHGA